MQPILGQIDRRVAAMRAVLAHRTFLYFSVGNFMSLSAIWIVRVCTAWLAWEMTHSKTWLGVIAFAELGPSVIVSIYSGALADVGDKLAILRRGQWAQVVLALIITIVTLMGALTVWWMLIVLIGFSIIGGLTLPARLSIAPSLVEKSQLATASAIGSISLNVTRLLGPLIAAPLIVNSLEGFAFLIAAAGFLVNALCLRAAGSSTPADQASAPTSGLLGYAQLLSSLFRDSKLGAILLLQFCLWLTLRPLTDMLPAFADQVFRSGEGGFAALTASVGLGALIGAFIMMAETEAGSIRRDLLASSAATAIAMLGFCMVDTVGLWMGIVTLVIYGAMVTATSVAATTFIQMQAPKERLGRIMSIYSLIFRFAPAAGALVFGFAADYFGLRTVGRQFALLGLICVAIYWAKTRKVAFNAEG